MMDEKDRRKLEKSKGLRFRLDMTCKDCIYDPEMPGTWRKQVEECTVTLCPLHPVRPMTTEASA